jgi:hypothetical protein
MSLILPLRSRIEFTANALPSFLLHAESRTDHEVVIVLDKCPLTHELTRRGSQLPCDPIEYTARDLAGRERVYRWLDSHAGLLAKFNVRVLETYGNETLWTGGLRSGHALNVGVEAASTDWIVGIGDEDLVFTRGWDEALWGALHDRDPMMTVATPVFIQPTMYHPPMAKSDITREWIHAQRALNAHCLPFPIAREFATDFMSARIGYTSFVDLITLRAAQTGVHEEACGERRMCHWVPMLMYRPLLRKVGGWPLDDAHAFSYDIGLDDALGKLGVRKRMPLDHFIMHSKHHAFLSEEVAHDFGEEEAIRILKDKPIL